jgi:4-amino-4-deoxy-L-arabinose transferase-like glycosyltransferase
VVLEYPKEKWVYVLLAILCLAAFFVRAYRTYELLNLHYDQGRDAQVVWDFWHKGEFFLLGPTTGIEGIFRGPFYYWLIAPFYLAGNGDPVWPAVFLAATTVAATALLFYLGWLIGGKIVGFTAVIVASFSFNLILASRWLSNPTPMFLLSMLLIYALFLVLAGRKWAWVVVGLLMGLAMQFGSAAEIFYFPAVLIFALIHKKTRPTKQVFFWALVALGITFLPQVIFDLRNQGILTNGIKKFLFEEKSFRASFWEIVKIRLPFYFDVFSTKILIGERRIREIIMWSSLGVMLFWGAKLKGNIRFTTTLLMFISPLVGMLFFQGNKGNVYDYYFTGYYFIFILLIAAIFGNISKHWWGKALIVWLLYIFLNSNVPIIEKYLTSKVEGPTEVTFKNQKKALDWIYSDLGSCQKFNQDAYVPPVIPHSYNYLFTWYGNTKHNCPPVEEQVNLLYTLYEVDPPHPERLEAWLERQKGIGKVEKEAIFGGITVQRRSRLGEV